MASRAIPARRTHFACVVEVKDTSMATGTVKLFNPSDGGRDIFVHVSVADAGGADKVGQGQKVSYDVVTTDRGRFIRRNRAMQLELGTRRPRWPRVL
jgi:CspA family cold shock protein